MGARRFRPNRRFVPRRMRLIAKSLARREEPVTDENRIKAMSQALDAGQSSREHMPCSVAIYRNYLVCSAF